MKTTRKIHWCIEYWNEEDNRWSSIATGSTREQALLAFGSMLDWLDATRYPSTFNVVECTRTMRDREAQTGTDHGDGNRYVHITYEVIETVEMGLGKVSETQDK